MSNRFSSSGGKIHTDCWMATIIPNIHRLHTHQNHNLYVTNDGWFRLSMIRHLIPVFNLSSLQYAYIIYCIDIKSEKLSTLQKWYLYTVFNADHGSSNLVSHEQNFLRYCMAKVQILTDFAKFRWLHQNVIFQ